MGDGVWLVGEEIFNHFRNNGWTQEPTVQGKILNTKIITYIIFYIC